MDSWPPRDWKPPADPAEERRLWDAYRTMLSRMTPEQLMDHASRNAALLQSQARAMTSMTLSDFRTGMDNPVLQRPSMAPPSSTDRPAQASQRSLQPSALDLLSSSHRLGPALATKLIVASARRSKG